MESLLQPVKQQPEGTPEGTSWGQAVVPPTGTEKVRSKKKEKKTGLATSNSAFHYQHCVPVHCCLRAIKYGNTR